MYEPGANGIVEDLVPISSTLSVEMMESTPLCCADAQVPAVSEMSTPAYEYWTPLHGVEDVGVDFDATWEVSDDRQRFAVGLRALGLCAVVGA